jgi:hypothetical protein
MVDMMDMMVAGVGQGRKVLHAKNAESRPSPSETASDFRCRSERPRGGAGRFLRDLKQGADRNGGGTTRYSRPVIAVAGARTAPGSHLDRATAAFAMVVGAAPARCRQVPSLPWIAQSLKFVSYQPLDGSTLAIGCMSSPENRLARRAVEDMLRSKSIRAPP